MPAAALAWQLREAGEEDGSEADEEESEDGRREPQNSTVVLSKWGVKADPPRQRQVGPNAICTTRFTLATWLPKSLYWQFHRVANVYFVLVAALACTPLWGRKWASKAFTVVCILLIQALKDGYEDLKRRQDDIEENSRVVGRYDPKERCMESVEWRDCGVGDLLLVDRAQQLPCDLLVLASAEPSGVFYLSTKSLDGETNLKERHVPPAALEALGQEAGPEDAAHRLLELGLEVELEAPHRSLVDMDCSLSVGGGARGGARAESFALRGCELQSTSWVLGMACYVGDDTKVRLNSSGAPSKTSELEGFLNKCVMCILAFIFSLALYFALASVLVSEEMDGVEAEDPPFYEVLVKYVVILYAVLPMTLYIAFEVLHLLIGFQIEADPRMLHEGMRAKARNTSVVEELGQVDFVFSDKTGTLTANEMRFAFCCLDDAVVGPFLPSPGGDGPTPGAEMVRSLLDGGPSRCADAARELFEALAVCHTVRLEEDGGYQGESPDEVALVEAARSVGFALAGRRSTAAGVVHAVRGPAGLEEHLVAHVLGFTSDRKRMSVVCPAADGGAVVMTKGADSVMQQLLAAPLPPDAAGALDSFAQQGLRTLVVGRRRLPAGSYAAWKARWEWANASMENRAERIAAVAAEAELDLTYVGITALEDRLQDGVPDTIAALREAGIRVWVLTGDKVETAVEIAKSCRLFEEGMHLAQAVGAASPQRAVDALAAGRGPAAAVALHGMVVDGTSAGHILSDVLAREAFYRLAASSSSCVCCRLSPMQKRELVELVREQDTRAITLAIGDGANDVPMIQGAHIGVGIRGKEGSASVQASDMAVSQFRFLGSLVFCHGRKAYRRMATFLCFFMYKSVVLGWSYIIYAHAAHFSGRLSFPEWLDILYNPLTSAAAVVALAFDFDYSDKEALRSPWLYSPGHNREYLNGWVFTKWMLQASLHGILAWTVPVYLLTSSPWERLEQTPSYWKASFTAFTVIVIIVHLKLLLVVEKPIGALGLGVIALEILAYVPMAAFLGSPLAAKLSPELSRPESVPLQVVAERRPLLCVALVPCAALLLDAVQALLALRRRPRRAGHKLLRSAEDSSDSEVHVPD